MRGWWCAPMLLALLTSADAVAEPGRPLVEAITRALPPGADLTTAPIDDSVSGPGGLERVRISFPTRGAGSSSGGARRLTIDRVATEGMTFDGEGRFAGADVMRLEGYELDAGPSQGVEVETITIERVGADVLSLLGSLETGAMPSTGRLVMDGIASDLGRNSRLEVDTLTIDAVDGGVARGLVVSSLRTTDGKGSLGAERIEVPVIDAPRILAMIGLYARTASDPTAAPEMSEVWRLSEGEAAATIHGIEAIRDGGATPLVGIERLTATSASDQDGANRTSWDLQRLVLDYTQLSEQAATVAAALGIDDQPIDLAMRTTTDPAARRSSLDRLRLDVGRVLSLEAQGELGAVPSTPLSQRMNVMTYAMASMQVPLRRLSMRLEDGGVVGRAIRLWAAMTDITADEAIVRAQAMAANALLPWRSGAGEVKVDSILAALDGFLRRSGSLTATLAPREPLSLATVATAAAAQPDLLLDAVEVVHAPPR